MADPKEPAPSAIDTPAGRILLRQALENLQALGLLTIPSDGTTPNVDQLRPLVTRPGRPINAAYRDGVPLAAPQDDGVKTSGRGRVLAPRMLYSSDGALSKSDQRDLTPAARRIHKILIDAGVPRSASDLATLSDLSRKTVENLLSTLALRGLVEKHPQGAAAKKKAATPKKKARRGSR